MALAAFLNSVVVVVFVCVFNLLSLKSSVLWVAVCGFLKQKLRKHDFGFSEVANGSTHLAHIKIKILPRSKG